MSKILKLTLGTGETMEVPLESTSVISVKTRTSPSPGEVFDNESAFTDVSAIELVDAPDVSAVETAPPPPAEITSLQAPDPATIETPDAAIAHAETLPIDQAATHIDVALTKFPGDEDLLAAKDEIAAIIAGTAWDGTDRRVVDVPRRVDTTTVPAAEQRVGPADRRTA